MAQAHPLPSGRRRLTRRDFLQIAGVAAGGLLAGPMLEACRREAPPAPAPTAAAPAAAAAKAALSTFGERVPELIASYYPEEVYFPDMYRKFSEDWAKLGLRIKLRPASLSSVLDQINQRTYGDMFSMNQPGRPERVDPTEFLVSRAHSSEAKVGLRNFGNYVNPEYDKWVDAEINESDLDKRRQYVLKAQEEVAKDYYICVIGHPTIIHAYNSEDWQGVVPVVGNGAAGTYYPWTFLNITSKTGKTRAIVGNTQLLRSLNILADTGGFRNNGRFIYDSFVRLDKDLKVVPWLAESWQNIDPKTWTITLRKGVKWHDGEPFTADDVKFTFDYLLKYKPGIMSLVWDPIDKVEIEDAAKGVVRFQLKKPYSPFLTIVMMMGYALPKHIWSNIMEKQGVSDPTKVVIDKPIGNGFFKFVHYKTDQEMLLAANKEHFAAPKIDELLMVQVPNIDGLIGRLETKEIDFISFALTPSQANRLKKQKHVTVVETDDIGFIHVTPFVSNMPWRDPELRKAFHYAVDKEFVINVLWEGSGTVGRNTYIAPANKFWHNPDLPQIKFDLNKARQILKDAGYGWDNEGYLLYPDPKDENYKKRIERVLAAR